MEPLTVNRRHKSSVGLTLIEVLIALAIIAIAMTAIIKAVTQNIRSTSYLQHKTLALWVGEDILNQARVGVIRLSEDDNDASNNTVSILGEDWHWQGRMTTTPNKQIKKINVDVYATEDEESPVISLESYVYAE